MKLPDDWSNASIYFILIDRFCNGDKSNDDFHHGEFDLNDDNCFQGGDLAGVIKRLPYIRQMGFDAIWITPPVHNQWVNKGSNVKGYHGYWAYDFCQVDPHFGDLSTYQQLVKVAHQLGLKVVQDIVINHTGNYFSINADCFARGDLKNAWSAVEQPPGLPTRPNDPLFCYNHPNDLPVPVYNFTPEISNYNDRQQTLNYSLADLDDLNLNNPLVVERLIAIYKYWVDTVGIDAFRVDTVYYTPPECYERFLHGKEGEEGIKSYVQRKFGHDFFVFGEIWVFDYLQQNLYLTNSEQQRLDSAIDIPLNEVLGQVFYEQYPTVKVANNLQIARSNRSLWINFIDNHDTERAFNRASWSAVAQSLVFIYGIPGIPVLYYGTEVGMKRTRENMFAENYFDGSSVYYDLIKKLQKFRLEHPTLSSGEIEIILSENKEGVLVFKNQKGGKCYLLAFNTSLVRKDLPIITSALTIILSSDPVESILIPGNNHLVLPAKSYAVFLLTNTQQELLFPTYSWDKFRQSSFSNIVTLLDWIVTTDATFTGERDFTVNSPNFKNGIYQINFFAQQGKSTYWVAGPAYEINNPFVELGIYCNHAGDAKVNLPTHPSYQGQLTIKKAKISAQQKNLQLTLQMANITNVWNPPNGIDHVYFSCYLDLPHVKGAGGNLKHIKMQIPDFDYNYYFLFYGWGAAIYQCVEGQDQILDVKINHQVNLATCELTMLFPQELFSDLSSIEGVKIHLSTWDGYLGRLHPISGHPHEYLFSSSASTVENMPLVYNQMLLTVQKNGAIQ